MHTIFEQARVSKALVGEVPVFEGRPRYLLPPRHVPVGIRAQKGQFIGN